MAISEKDNGSVLLTVSVFLMIGYQLLYILFPVFDSGIHRIIHLCLAFVVVSLAIMRSKEKSKAAKPLFWALIIIGIVITSVLVSAFDEVLSSQVLPPLRVTIAALIGLLFCFIITWLRYGKIFVVLTVCAIGYAILGPQYLPEAIAPPEVSIMRILAWVAGDIGYEWGVYGGFLSLMANYIWLFMVFGSFLQAFGGLHFIHQLGTFFSSKSAGGPASLAVVTSALVGTVSGSTVGNVAITGSFTIPLMKKHGYTPEQAGAIELAASSGGQILPPIMGVVAFIMADFIGMPYIKVIYHALIPALLYFLSLFVYVQLNAMKLNTKPMPAEVNLKDLLISAPTFIVPFVVMVWLMTVGYSLMFVALCSIAAIVVVGTVVGFIKDEYRLNWQDIKEKLNNGVVTASEISILCGLLGALLAIGEMSGVGFKLSALAVDLAGGNLFLLLVLAAITSLILGTGLPTVAAYVLTATVLGQALVSMGIPFIAAHLFLLVFAVSAHCTPPIGIGLVVAQKMAGGSYWGTGRDTLIAIFIMFFLPFFYIYTPAVLLLTNDLKVSEIIIQFATILVFQFSTIFFLNRWCVTKVTAKEMILFFGGAILPLFGIGIKSQSIALVTCGIVCCFSAIFLNYHRSKNNSNES